MAIRWRLQQPIQAAFHPELVEAVRGWKRRPPGRGRMVISGSGCQAIVNVKSLEQAVEDLDHSALAKFRRWFAEFDAAA